MTTSEQARADAIADATQLRLVIGDDALAERAYHLGGWVIAHLAHGATESAVEMASKAAHVAFYAVPGLR